MVRLMETTQSMSHPAPAAKRFAVLAVMLIGLLMAAAPPASAQGDGGDVLLTKDELRLRTLERLMSIEDLRDAMATHPSSDDYCRRVGHIVGTDNFARCWIAAEDNAEARARAISKADALATVIRALLAKPTTTAIKPAAVGISAPSRALCYNRTSATLDACYDI